MWPLVFSDVIRLQCDRQRHQRPTNHSLCDRLKEKHNRCVGVYQYTDRHRIALIETHDCVSGTVSRHKKKHNSKYGAYLYKIQLKGINSAK